MKNFNKNNKTSKMRKLNKTQKKVDIINMAFGKGTESKELAPFDKYIGIAPFFVVGVNMTMKELQDRYPDRNYTKEMNYFYNEEGKSKGIFVTFNLETNPEHKICNGVKFTGRAAYLIKDELFISKEGKYQIINDYGDTCWVTKEDFNNKIFPSNYIVTGARPAYVGEEMLTKFIKTFIGIPASRIYNRDTKVWTPKEGKELEEAQAGFDVDDIKKIIAGDVSVIKEVIKYQPDNQIKFPVVIKVASDNKEYNEIYSPIPIRFGDNSYKSVKDEINRLKEGNRATDIIFGEFPYEFKKYEVNMTTFTPDNNTLSTQEDPFAGFN